MWETNVKNSEKVKKDEDIRCIDKRRVISCMLTWIISLLRWTCGTIGKLCGTEKCEISEPRVRGQIK